MPGGTILLCEIFDNRCRPGEHCSKSSQGGYVSSLNIQYLSTVGQSLLFLHA